LTNGRYQYVKKNLETLYNKLVLDLAHSLIIVTICSYHCVLAVVSTNVLVESLQILTCIGYNLHFSQFLLNSKQRPSCRAQCLEHGQYRLLHTALGLGIILVSDSDRKGNIHYTVYKEATEFFCTVVFFGFLTPPPPNPASCDQRQSLPLLSSLAVFPRSV
jgi:hypothetical protein